jgi:hypothetical protein
MNRRSMIKHTALGASVALMAASEGQSQEQNTPAESRPTPVVNARDPRTKKSIPIDAHVTNEPTVKVSGTVSVNSRGVRWEYEFAESITQLKQFGENGWEAGGVRTDGKILSKRVLLRSH